MLDPELSRRYLAAVGVVGWRLRADDDGEVCTAPEAQGDAPTAPIAERPKVSGAQAALAAIAEATRRKPQGARAASGDNAPQPPRHPPTPAAPPSTRNQPPGQPTSSQPPAATSRDNAPEPPRRPPTPAAPPLMRSQPLAPPTSSQPPAAATPRPAPAPARPQPPPPAVPAAHGVPPDHPAFATEQPPLDEDAAWYAALDGPATDPDLDLVVPPDLAPSPPVPEDPAAAIARMDWDALQSAVAGCRRCQLCETRTQTVFGVGNREADLMLVGEAPGQEEDRRGEPFVGRAGQLLERMLAAIGLDRNRVFIANVLKCRPPRNRDPQPQEAAACQHYLARQIALVQPRLLLCVGRISAQHLLQSTDSVGRLRGRLHHLGHERLPLLVTYHPSYYLRTPTAKARGWEDLQRVARLLRDAAG